MDRTAKAERSRSARRRGRTLAAVLIVGIILYAFAGQEIRLLTVRAQERRLEEAIRAQQVKNQILKEQIEILQRDEYIEKVAREQLGWIKAGEIQYVPEPGR
jgi:cell division protein FtsB